jgi:2-polyprenyl-3-methyl-5-hydroxy-6-metoxy-1,4-benzoquinol methylase
MQPGPVIRRLFGPYEHTVAEAYRHIFVNLDDFARLIHTWVPQAQRILEVGCGEGAMTERIMRIYPAATITVEAVASRQPASFDLVILADVIHHVPADARRSLMCGIDQAMAPDGSFIFKDWVITKTPIHWLSGVSDRYLTGDEVSYLTMPIIERLLIDPFGPSTIRQTATVRPWHNNVAVLVHR